MQDEHPDTLRSMSNLACSYKDLGLTDDAITFMQKAADGLERILGCEHQHTRDSKKNLAVWLG